MQLFAPPFPWYAATLGRHTMTNTPYAPEDLLRFIRNIPDFPKPGILFRDITPLLADQSAFRAAIEHMASRYRRDGVDMVAAAEARGFIFAAPLAMQLRAGFVPIRKPGKLPFERHTLDYDLEYGSNSIEMHQDALHAGHRVLLVDDVLATGGTMQACARLVSGTGATIVGCAFLLELSYLDGRRRLDPHDVFSLLEFDQ
jgi:adenine phosphoribosyltransferase